MTNWLFFKRTGNIKLLKGTKVNINNVPAKKYWSWAFTKPRAFLYRTINAIKPPRAKITACGRNNAIPGPGTGLPFTKLVNKNGDKAAAAVRTE